MTSNNTQNQLATINGEQLDAIIEIILAAPDDASPNAIAEVLEITINDAVDRAFELEKLTKIAAEDFYAETGVRALPSMVATIVESVWNTIHREQDPNDQHHGGLLPGFEQDPPSLEDIADTISAGTTTSRQMAEGFGQDAAENYATAWDGAETRSPVEEVPKTQETRDRFIDIAADIAEKFTGTAITATVNDDGGTNTSTGYYDIGGLLPQGEYRTNDTGTPQEVTPNSWTPPVPPTHTTEDGRNVWTGNDAATVGKSLIEHHTNDGTTIEPANDPETLAKLIEESRPAYPARSNLTGPASSPRFGVDEVPPIIQTTRRIGNHAAPEPDDE